MAFKRKSKGNDKYLRLTGLWQSKNNDALWTGRLKAEQVADLMKKVEEAGENEAPLVFSLWENEKKESKRDPDFSLQCFVGDAEESPRSNRGSTFSRKEKEEPEEEEEEAPEEEEDEKPKKGATKPGKTSKRSSSW